MKAAITYADEESPHPGKAVRVPCLELLGLSVTEAARVLGVTRQSLSNLINGKTGISQEMAAQALKHEKQIRVDRYAPQPAA